LRAARRHLGHSGHARLRLQNLSTVSLMVLGADHFTKCL
jgi:hypothetical protein